MHDGLVVVAVLFGVAFLGWLYERFRKWRDTLNTLYRDDPVYLWRCHRSQGGGVVDTPHAMTKTEALKWCGDNLGFIMYVDEEHHFIFYRAKN